MPKGLSRKNENSLTLDGAKELNDIKIYSQDIGMTIENATMTQYSSRSQKYNCLKVFVYFHECIISPIFIEKVMCEDCFNSRWLNNYKKRQFEKLIFNKIVHNTNHILPAAKKIITCLIEKKIQSYNNCQSKRESYAYIVNLNTLQVSLHKVISHSLCPRCREVLDDSPIEYANHFNDQVKINTTSTRTHTLADIEGNISDVTDTRMGIFNTILYDDKSPFAVCVANLPLAMGLDEPGIGRTNDYHSSKIVATLEGLERYCGFEVKSRLIAIKDSYENLHSRTLTLNPLDLAQHSPQQYQIVNFPFKPYSGKRVHEWVWGYSFGQRQAILVPKFAAFYGYFHEPEYGHAPFYEISNGCALGGDLQEAIIHGILELVERDAFLMTWYKKLTPKQITLESVSDISLIEMIWRFEFETNYKLTFYDITQESGIPVILVLAEHPDSTNLIKQFCATGCHPNPISAMKTAIHEVAGILVAMQTKYLDRKNDIEKMLADPRNVKSMEDHALVNASPHASERFLFLKSAEKIVVPDAIELSNSISQDTELLVARLLKHYSDVIFVDQTPIECRERNLYCVKVIIPDLLPMTFGYQMRRVHNVARLKNCTINSNPHPFP